MADKSRAPGGAFMNRMMPNDYEKRGMATGHLRQAMAEAGQAQSAKIPAPASAPAQSDSPKKDG